MLLRASQSINVPVAAFEDTTSRATRILNSMTFFLQNNDAQALPHVSPKGLQFPCFFFSPPFPITKDIPSLTPLSLTSSINVLFLAFNLVGRVVFRILKHFNTSNISVISRLGSRRHLISEIEVARPRFEPLSPQAKSLHHQRHSLSFHVITWIFLLFPMIPSSSLPTYVFAYNYRLCCVMENTEI